MIDYVTKRLDNLPNELLGSVIGRFDLKKFISAPTRKSKILDQILTNKSDFCDRASLLPPLSRSDHQCLFLEPKIRLKIPPLSKMVRIAKAGKSNDMSIRITNTDWDAVFSADDIDLNCATKISSYSSLG